MKKHEVNFIDLKEWQVSKEVLFASSTKENKHLYGTLSGSFKVYHNNLCVLETVQPFTACEKYNSI